MEWKPMIYKGIDMSDRFLVSDQGEIYSLVSKKLLKFNIHKDTGYKMVCVSLGSRKKRS